MKAKLALDDDQLVIYVDKPRAYLEQGLLSVALIAAGSLVCYLADGERFLYVFGGFWIFCGLLLSTNVIYIHRNYKDQEVAAFLTVNHNSLTISADFQLPKTTYNWSDITKIILAKKLHVESIDGTGYSWHQVVIYFQADMKIGLLQRNMLGIGKSANGYLYTTVKYPKNNASIVLNALHRFSEGRVDISLYDKVDINEPSVLALLK